MRLRGAVFLILLAVPILHGGAIRKDRNIITETQTDPISLQKKMEEIKDGEKGPPTPSFKFYEGKGFLAKSPVEDGVGESSAGTGNQIPMFGDPVPENLEGMDPVTQDEWWAESWGHSEAENAAKTSAAQWAEDW